MFFLKKLFILTLFFSNNAYATNCKKTINTKNLNSSIRLTSNGHGLVNLQPVKDLILSNSRPLRAFLANRRLVKRVKIAEEAINDMLLEALSQSFFNTHAKLDEAIKHLDSNWTSAKDQLLDYRANIVEIIRDTEVDEAFLKKWSIEFSKAVESSRSKWSSERQTEHFNESEWNELFDLIKFPEVIFFNVALKSLPNLLKAPLIKIDRQLNYMASANKSPLPGLVWIGSIVGGLQLATNGYDQLAIPFAITGVVLPLGVFVKDIIWIARTDNIDARIRLSRQAIKTVLSKHSEELVQYQKDLNFYAKNSIDLVLKRLSSFEEALKNERTLNSEETASKVIGHLHRLVSGTMLSTSFFTGHPFVNPRRITVERLELALALGFKMSDLSKEDIKSIQAELDTMTAQIKVLKTLKEVLSTIVSPFNNNSSDVVFSRLTRTVGLKLLYDLELQIKNLEASYDEALSILDSTETVFAYLNSSLEFQLTLEQTLRTFQEMAINLPENDGKD